MLLFCPGCGNGLIVEEGQRCHRFACNTCPYVHNITRKVSSEAGVLAARAAPSQRPRARAFLPAVCFLCFAEEVPKFSRCYSCGVAPATRSHSFGHYSDFRL